MEVLQLCSEGKSFPNADVMTLKGKVPWLSGATEYHKVTLNNNLTQEIYWKKHMRVAVSP